MQIGADRVRGESLLYGGDRLAENKAPTAMADIEDDPALPRFQHIRADVTLLIDYRNSASDLRVSVSEDITGPQVLEQQVFQRQLGNDSAEVHHHRDIGEAPGLYRAIYGIPLGASIMGDLDAHEGLRELPDAHRREFWIHVGQALLRRITSHARAHDIQKSEKASF